MNKKSELLVITETKRLIDYIFTVTEKVLRSLDIHY